LAQQKNRRALPSPGSPCLSFTNQDNLAGLLGGWTGYSGKPGPKVMRWGFNDFQRIKFGTTLSLHDV
jgi:hypothetical protein